MNRKRLVPCRQFMFWLTAIGVAVLAGCSAVESAPIPDAPPGVTIVKLSGLRPAETPPDVRTANVSPLETAASLHRVVVRYIKYSKAFKTDPETLFSDAQIDALAPILARELPKLTATQRLRLTFADRHFGRGYLVELDLYREGTFLVYWFNSLATNFSTPTIGGEGNLFLGILQQAAPGQEVANRDTFAYLKDPLLSEERDTAAAIAEKQKLVEQALTDGVIESDESVRLEELAAKPTPSAHVWSTYWDRRRTLKKALDQNLMDRANYQVQLDKLNAELTR